MAVQGLFGRSAGSDNCSYQGPQLLEVLILAMSIAVWFWALGSVLGVWCLRILRSAVLCLGFFAGGKCLGVSCDSYRGLSLSSEFSGSEVPASGRYILVPSQEEACGLESFS